jgi:hypothetical protein
MRSTTSLVVLGLVLGTAGCSLVGGSPSPATAPSPAGPAEPARPDSWQETYGGQVDFKNQTLMLVLELGGPGGRQVDGTLTIAAIPLTAKGSGTRQDGAYDLRLGYQGSCAGTVELHLRPGDGEGTLVGTLDAKDCTGEEGGALRLLRRSPRGLDLEAPAGHHGEGERRRTTNFRGTTLLSWCAPVAQVDRASAF